MALEQTTLSIPVSGGLDTKTDNKQVVPGRALALENVRFQKTGKLSKRYGLVLQEESTDDGPLDTHTVAAVVADDEYMAAITDNGVYGLSSSSDQWFKQSRFSVSFKGESEFASKTIYEQKSTDCDVSADGKFLVTVFRQEKGSLTPGYMLVLEDLETGLKKTTAFTNTANNGLCRVIITNDNIPRVHLFYYSTGSIVARTIYDKNLAIISGPTTITTCADDSQFDLCKDSSTIYFARITTTSCYLEKYNFAGTIQNTNTVTLGGAIGTNLNAAYGMSITTTNNNLHLAWCYSAGGTAIQGFDKTLIPAISVITFPSNYRKVSICATSSGIAVSAGRQEAVTVPAVEVFDLTFTTTYTVGATSFINARSIPLAQPFFSNGKIMAPLKSYEDLNRSFFIINANDAYCAGKMSPDSSADPLININNYVYMLPKTPIVDGIARTAIPKRYKTGENDNDLGRPVEFFSTTAASVLEMDFNPSKSDGTRAKVGEAILFNRGLTLEVDRQKPHENGFLYNPNIDSLVANNTGANPNVASKNFRYVTMYEYVDSFGQITRSTPGIPRVITTAANTASIAVNYNEPCASLKFTAGNTLVNTPIVVIYRTQDAGSVFFRLAEIPGGSGQGIINTYTDTASDASIANNETLYTTGGVLQNDPAPIGRFCFGGGNRLFIGGLEEKDELAFSRKQLYGESVAFSDFFRIRVSSGSAADRSNLSGGAYMDGKVIIFRGQSISFCQGDGPTETGEGSFSDPEPIASDVGCTDARSILNTPDGVMFKSRKGIYLLNRGLSVSYIGADVEAYNQYSVIASLLSDTTNEARFYLENGTCLVYNYLFKVWSVFTGQTLVDADIWRGSPVSIADNNIYLETENTYLDGGPTGFYGMKFTSPWLKLELVQGYVRCYQLWVIGDYKSPHTLKCRVYTDYDEATYEDYSLVYDPTDGIQYQFQISIPNQKVQAIKFEIYDETWGSGTSGEAYDLSNIQVEIGVKKGGYKLAASKSY